MLHRSLVLVLAPLGACYHGANGGAADDGIADASAAGSEVGDAETSSHATSNGTSATSAGEAEGPGSSAADAGSGGSDGSGGGAQGESGSCSRGGEDPPPPIVCEKMPGFDGQATWYELATPLVNCSYETSTLPQYYGALNTAQYADAAQCGACARVTGPDGTIDVEIVDQCPIDTNPICYEGHIDLSPAAFDAIGDPVDGIIAIDWEWVACDVTGPIQYVFKEGSSAFWTAVQIRNHRYAIASVQWQSDDGMWHDAVRTDYNYFIADEGMGPGPYTLRVTDVYGHQVVDDGIALAIMTPIDGHAQLDACE